jgi:hypothetical protein
VVGCALAVLGGLLAAPRASAHGGDRHHTIIISTQPPKGTGDGRQPGLAFADSRPLTVDLSRLFPSGAKPNDEGTLPVDLVNLLRHRQTISVRVVGLEPLTGASDPFIATLFPATGGGAVLRSRATVRVDVPAAYPAGKAGATSYKGVIVAVGQTGQVVRRKLTVTVPRPPAQPLDPEVNGARLTAAGLEDVTLPATNFAPSLLSPLGPGLLVLGIIAAVVAVVLQSTLRSWAWLVLVVAITMMGVGGALHALADRDLPSGVEGVRILLIAGAAVALLFALGAWLPGRWSARNLMVALTGAIAAGAFLAAGLLDAYGGRLPGTPNASLVATKPQPVAGDVVPGRVGLVRNDSGDLAEMRVDSGELDVENLRRAGAYTGTVDLNGDKDGGSAKATVNVRDWWLWAALAIAGGVALGYVVRRYFQVQRPRAQTRARLDSLWREVLRKDSASQSVPGIRRARRLRMLARARARARDVAAKLDGDQLEAANAALDDFEKYAEEFDGVRLLARELDRLHERLRRAFRLQPFGVASASKVVALTSAEEALDDDDPEDPDVAKTVLNAQKEAISAAKGLVRVVLAYHTDLTELLVTANRLYDAAVAAGDEPRKQKCSASIHALQDLGRQLLTQVDSTDAAAITTIKAGADAQRKALGDLAEQIVSAGALDLQTAAVLPSLRIDGDMKLRAVSAPSLVPVPAVAAEALQAQLHSVVVGQAGDVPGWSGDADDGFVFDATMSGHGDEDLAVDWRFGDGAQPVGVLIGPDGDGARVRHQFAAGATSPEVSLSAGEWTLAKHTVELIRPGRADRARTAFGIRDREMTLLAGVLAVGSGMLTLYFADAAWGVPQDYLKAALWGGVVAEGSRLVGTLVSRTWGQGGA